MERLTPLTSAYEFYELLFIMRIKNRPAHKDVIETIPNSRFLWVDDTMDYYNMRAVAASEAIGDRVIITTFPDLEQTGVFSRLRADDGEDIEFFRYDRGFASAVFRMLASFSKYKIDPAFSDTILIRQASLHKLHRLPEKRLAYRFPHNSNLSNTVINAVEKKKSGFRNLKRRFNLLLDVVYSSLTAIFLWLSMLSAFSALIGVSYFIYAALVYASGIDTQPGWFSISIVLSFFIVVLSLFIFSCSVFFLYYAETLTKPSSFEYDIVEMDENLRLFSKLESEANVVD
ncbi:hypothetical protein N9W89_10705 [Hellea sp.]|nr:hypothetical protein [Hellea sp.]